MKPGTLFSCDGLAITLIIFRGLPFPQLGLGSVGDEVCDGSMCELREGTLDRLVEVVLRDWSLSWIEEFRLLQLMLECAS